MRAAVGALRDRFEQACLFLAAALLVLSVVVMTAQIVLRVVFNAPLIWSEEVVRYLFVWVVYLGTVVGVIRGTHIRVMFAVERLGPATVRLSNAASRIVNFICFAFLLYWGIDLALKYRLAQFYTLPGWPQIWFYYASLPLAAGLSLLFVILPSGPRSEERPSGETAL